MRHGRCSLEGPGSFAVSCGVLAGAPCPVLVVEAAGMGATSCIVYAGAPGLVLPTKGSRIDEVPCRVGSSCWWSVTNTAPLTTALVLTRTERFLSWLCVLVGK